MIVRKAISDLRGFCEEKRRGNAKSAKGLCGLCVRILCGLCVENIGGLDVCERNFRFGHERLSDLRTRRECS